MYFVCGGVVVLLEKFTTVNYDSESTNHCLSTIVPIMALHTRLSVVQGVQVTQPLSSQLVHALYLDLVDNALFVGTCC